MAKPLANATAMSATIVFIEGHLRMYTTRGTQIEALNVFTATHSVQMSSVGYNPYQPTGIQLYALLKRNLTAPGRLRIPTMKPEELVTQLFTRGRTILDNDFMVRLTLPQPTVATNPGMRNLQANQSMGDTDRDSTSELVPSQQSQFTASGELAAGQPLQTLQYSNDTATGAQEDLAEQTGKNNNTSEHDANTGDIVDIMGVPLELCLQHLHEAIVGTACIIFPKDMDDGLAQIDLSPSPELLEMYRQVLVKEGVAYKPVIIDLLSKHILTTRAFFQSLVWVFVRTAILENTSSLDDLYQFLDPSKAPGSYVEQVLSSEHNFSLGDVRREFLDAQLRDETFRRETLRPRAAVMANDLMLILAGHIDQLDKSDLPCAWHREVVGRLVIICQDALILRGRLLGQAREWELVTFSNGDAPLGPEVEIDSRFPGSHIAFTIRPGLCLRYVENEREVESYQPAALVAMGGEKL